MLERLEDGNQRTRGIDMCVGLIRFSERVG